MFFKKKRKQENSCICWIHLKKKIDSEGQSGDIIYRKRRLLNNDTTVNTNNSIWSCYYHNSWAEEEADNTVDPTWPPSLLTLAAHCVETHRAPSAFWQGNLHTIIRKSALKWACKQRGSEAIVQKRSLQKSCQHSTQTVLCLRHVPLPHKAWARLRAMV